MELSAARRLWSVQRGTLLPGGWPAALAATALSPRQSEAELEARCTPSWTESVASTGGETPFTSSRRAFTPT